MHESRAEHGRSSGRLGAEKRDGFAGQRLVVLPPTLIDAAFAHPLAPPVLPTDIGVFPRAAEHLRSRPEGVDQAILIYCDAGAGWCELGGQLHHVGSGDLLVIPPGRPHAYAADDARPWTIFWVHARGSGLPAYLNALEATAEHPVLRFGALSSSWRQGIGAMLDALENRPTPADIVYAAHVLTTLLASAPRRAVGPSDAEAAVHPSIARVLTLMEERLASPLSVTEMARTAGLSRSHFQLAFKAATGVSPLSYFIELKMKRACWLLAGTRQPVAAIALALGYHDPLYFSRAFRAIHGVSPRAYRQRSG